LPTPQSLAEELEDYIAPRTLTEQKLASIWAQVLKLDRIGAHDNFFELGGDSIQSMLVVARANQVGLKFTVRQLFDQETLADLALLIGDMEDASGELNLADESAPLSCEQDRTLRAASIA
jgi:aryl carrier-like protein